MPLQWKTSVFEIWLASRTHQCPAGLPPVNGVLPQSPMHTKALSVVVSKQRRPPQKHHAASGREAGQQQQHYARRVQQQHSSKPGAGNVPRAGMVVSSSCHALVGMNAVTSSQANLASLAGASSGASASPVLSAPTTPAVGMVTDVVLASTLTAVAQPAQETEQEGDQEAEELVVQLEVAEQRLSNLLQSLAVGVGLAITPALRQIPSAVLWGEVWSRLPKGGGGGD